MHLQNHLKNVYMYTKFVVKITYIMYKKERDHVVCSFQKKGEKIYV